MPVLTGFFQSAAQQWARDHLNIVPLDALGDHLYADRQASAIKVGSSGTLTRNEPVESGGGRVLGGFKVRGYADDWYYRVHVNPKEIDLGNAMSAQTREVEVWNAWPEVKQLSTINGVGTDGLSLQAPAAPPTNFGPLELRTYVLGMSVTGPAVIDASFTFVFPDEAPKLVVIGKRVVVFPFPPNWQSPVTESLEWKTQVLRAFDGTEQRRSLRTHARRSFSYSVLVTREKTAKFENLLWGWQHRMYGMPVWTDKSRLTGDVAADTSVLNLSTGDLSFAVGGLAILYQDDTHFEVVAIESMTSASITTQRPVAQSWSAGTLVMPCVVAHLPNSVATLRHSSNTLTAVVDFSCDPTLTDDFTPTVAAPVTYNGVEVVTRQPNWRNPIDNTWENAYALLDKDSGAIQQLQKETFPRIKRSYSWLLRNRPAITDFREWLGRMLGQAKTAYVPTWHDDFVLATTIGADVYGFEVQGNGFEDLVGLTTTRDRIMIRLKDGTSFYRRLTAVGTSGANIQLAIDSPLGRQVVPADVASIHVLARCRLASDRVDLVWYSTGVVVANTPMITVKE